MTAIFSLVILASITAIVGLYFLFDYLETKRYAHLSEQNRERLQREDAIWSQTFSF